MNFKLKALVVAMAMSAAASAGAATNGSAGSSSVIFSAWDDNGSYSLDLGSTLNDLIGADVSGGTSSTNTLNASGSSYAGTVASDGTLFNIKLTGFNLTSGSWNLVAGDTATRYRLLFSEASAPAGVTNSQVKNAANVVNSYIGYGAAASTTTGTLATSADAWYANSANWGSGLGGTGINGTANALGSSSNLYVSWQQSLASTLGGSAAGLTNFTAGGKNVYATTYTSGADTYLKVAVAAPVPEADSWAMMLAGLGLMGFIARRRTQA